MSIIRRVTLAGGAVIAVRLAVVSIVSAQVLMPGTSPYAAPPPPPLPIPKITVPVVPKLDAPATPSYQPAQPSFGDRVQSCLDAAAAAGYGPSDREVYARSCANR